MIDLVAPVFRAVGNLIAGLPELRRPSPIAGTTVAKCSPATLLNHSFCHSYALLQAQGPFGLVILRATLMREGGSQVGFGTPGLEGRVSDSAPKLPTPQDVTPYQRLKTLSMIVPWFPR